MVRFLPIICALSLISPVFSAELGNDFNVLVEKASIAVVNISTTKIIVPNNSQSETVPGLKSLPPDLRDFLDRFFDQPRPAPHGEPRAHGLGSGFIISPDGYLLTAAHVVKDADEIIVQDTKRREWKAKIIGTDSLIDIALLKVEANDLPMAQIGNSDLLKVGQWVLAIGQPFGLDYTATAGIVSALGRSLPHDTYVPFIQTDVALNPGNSGGPLYNLDGAVVGINAQIYSPSGGYAGLSFAIPINVAMDAANQIKIHGRVIRGWLGITIQQVSQNLAASFNLERSQGALVSNVATEGPAKAAGIQIGDIILAYGEQSINSAGDLPPLVGRTRPGENIPLTVLRNGKELILVIAVAELPREITTPKSKKNKQRNKTPILPPMLGLTVTDLPRGGGSPSGVLVKRVEEGPARAAGIHPRDIIARIGGIAIRDVEHFRQLVAKLPSERTIPVLVIREGNPMFLALRIP